MTARPLAGGGFEGSADEVCDALGLPPSAPGEAERFESAGVRLLLEEALDRIDLAVDRVDAVAQRRLSIARCGILGALERVKP